MTSRIVIFGAGGLGREVLQTLRDQQLECLGFFVDPDIDAPAVVNGAPVHRDLAVLAADASIQFVVALGHPPARARVVGRIERLAGLRFATVVHPAAVVGQTVSVGPGCIVLQTASLTADVRIGRHVVINPQVSIAHDCVVEDFVSLAPGVTLAGGVHIEQGCELGSGATVIPRQRVGRWSVVGAGAVIIAPVEANSTVVGVPARRTSARPDGWQNES